MILTAIAIQTTCVMVATSYLIKNLKPRKASMKVSSNANGYKIYKTF